MLKKSDLWHEHKAQGAGGAEEDEDRDDEEGDVLLVAQHKRDGRPHHAHDHHVVHRHSDVFAVVERRNAHVTRFPRQKRAEYLQKNQDIFAVNVVANNQLEFYFE